MQELTFADETAPPAWALRFSLSPCWIKRALETSVRQSMCQARSHPDFAFKKRIGCQSIGYVELIQENPMRHPVGRFVYLFVAFAGKGLLRVRS